MNWYKKQLKIAFPGPGGLTQKSDKWEEVETNKETIQNLLDEAYSKKEIADLFGVSYQLFIKMLNRLKIYRSVDVVKQKAQEMLDGGASLGEVTKTLKVSPNRIKKLLGLETRDMNYTPGIPISSEEGKEIERLHVEEGLRPTQISKKTGRPISSIITYLNSKNVYDRLRGDWVRFDPTQEQIRQIDQWYALPPEGEGKSLAWIAKQFGLLDQQMGYWFKKTGRPTRNFQEQANTPYSKGRMSEIKLKEWEEIGGLRGRLLSYPTMEQATKFLNMYVNRLLNQGQNKKSVFPVYTKYIKIINDYTFPDETLPQQETDEIPPQQQVVASANWYKRAQINDGALEQYPKYTEIGHGDEEKDWISHDLDALWISDLNGNNFHMSDPINYDHLGLANDVGLNMQTGIIQGRFDADKNIVSLTYDPRIVTMKEIPNRLMNRLYREFGDNITIIDYSHGSGKRLI